MALSPLIVGLIAGVAGIVGGYLVTQQFGKKNTKSVEEVDKKIAEKISAAKAKVEELREQAKKEAVSFQTSAEKELEQRRANIITLEDRIAEREKRTDEKLATLEKKEADLEQTKKALEQAQTEVTQLKADEEKQLAEIAGLTREQAEQRVLTLAEERTKEEIVRQVRRLKKEGERDLEEEAHNILATVIQRYASSHVAENSTSYVDVPDPSMIGRIIGKEGRNIQQLEKLTGCEIVVDSESDNSIMVSGFSPIRRQVAKKAIEALIKDGRIHPGRIEDAVEEAKKAINKDMQEAGETVVYDLGIIDFPPQLVQLIGRMKYRTSYRQNILKHSWEAAKLAGMLAEELGADVTIAKKATLLHDIGKAIDHEVEGNHVEIGEKIMAKFGISDAIVKAAAAHHEDYPFATREAIIVQVSDAISAARPGARHEDTEGYVKRMEDLENIATSYDGVAKAYAIYAGREIRVFVEADKVDDLKAIQLAQDIAKQIEQELTYPGDVKVNVIRETRADALAR